MGSCTEKPLVNCWENGKTKKECNNILGCNWFWEPVEYIPPGTDDHARSIQCRDHTVCNVFITPKDCNNKSWCAWIDGKCQTYGTDPSNEWNPKCWTIGSFPKTCKFQQPECKWFDIKVNDESVVYGCRHKEFCGFNKGNDIEYQCRKNRNCEYKNGKCSRIKTDSSSPSTTRNPTKNSGPTIKPTLSPTHYPTKFSATDVPTTSLTAHFYVDKYSTFKDGNGTYSATADGDPIALWMNNAQSKGNLISFKNNWRPTLKLNVVNGLGVVHFDGTGVYLFNDIVYDPPYTFIVVQRVFGPGQQGGAACSGLRSCRLFNSYKSNWLIGFWAGRRDAYYSEGQGFIEGDPFTLGGDAVMGEWIITVATSNGKSGTLFTNGKSKVSGYINKQGPKGIALGCQLGEESDSNLNNPNECSVGQVAEFLVYSRELKVEEWKDIMTYLQNKFNITF